MSENTFMQRAIALALENVQSGHGGPFGALVVKDGKIIAEATNNVASTNDPTAHAEIVAIRQACKKLGKFHLEGCEIYASCEACPMCLGAIYWSRLDRIYFAATAADAAKAGFDDSFIYQEISKPHAERKIPVFQLLREEALDPFRAWEQKPDRVSY
ncbi:MAG: nucleoside deaminase [Candidatus Acidiferrales bacterium]|jgi:guanine deaminase